MVYRYKNSHAYTYIINHCVFLNWVTGDQYSSIYIMMDGRKSYNNILIENENARFPLVIIV